MKQACTMALLALAAATQAADFRMMPRLGDARRGAFRQAVEQPYFMLDVKMPEGTHTALTAIVWARLPVYGKSQLTTSATWCPSEIERFHPDLLAGAGGHGGEIDLTALGGAVAVPNPGFAPYAGAPEHVVDKWPLGVATIAGQSGQAITVSVGGNDAVVGPGSFNRNIEVGPAGGVVISGAGKCSVGVSQTPCCQFYNEIDSVRRNDGTLGLTPESLVTNTWAMLSFRWSAPGNGSQIYRADLGRLHAFDALGMTKTNTTGHVTSYSSKGVYQLWLVGLLVEPPLDIEVFDLRTFGRWLSDAEMERIHANSVQEILRRWPETPQ